MAREFLQRHPRLRDIAGDIVRLETRGVALGELALIDNGPADRRLARVIEIDRTLVTLQVLAGSRGLATNASVRFLGEPATVTCSTSVLGRVFRGDGRPLDRGPILPHEPRVCLEGPPVNPMMRAVPRRMIETGVPMIDIFNTLVESQKIPILSVPGQPHDALLARIGFQADADVVVFGGLGLAFDDYRYFADAFDERGVMHRTTMFVNLASDSIVERLLVPDMALAVAERFAIDARRRVLVLLTDMTAYADALKEVGLMLEHIPANRGYLGDLYTQLARRYERACDFRGGGSVTVLSVTTMPGDDVTHPVPDNTGYITEGQIRLSGGMIDPFGSLSRLKQNVIGHVTRDDHDAVASTMIRLFAGAGEAERKRAMAFDLSAFDERLLRFGDLFRQRFMRLDVDLPLSAALDLCWSTLADCFAPEELLMRDSLIASHYPSRGR